MRARKIDQLNQLRAIFTRFDMDADGSLTILELAALLRSLGLKPSGDQIHTLLSNVDSNGNGAIEFEELVSAIMPDDDHLSDEILVNQDQLMEVFRSFDRDGNGYITAAELAGAMAKMGQPLTYKELTEMIREADVDGDGVISFNEFATVMARPKKMANIKQTLRKVSTEDLHLARLVAMAAVGVSWKWERLRNLTKPMQLVPPMKAKGKKKKASKTMLYRGYNEVGEPVLASSEVLNLNEDYVEEEFEEAHPMKIKDKKATRWILPPSTLTLKRLKNLQTKGLLGDVEAFVPYPGHATNLGKEICTRSGPHTKQGAILPLHPYFKMMANYYKICLMQFTSKEINYFSALFVLYAK
ncbi:hypothetical protein F8388_019535 [Cannabis sativa]|uniref:EF-hand domain-containing protein n=1 Tax=Cannabis sativa TaxID=3483 RepID=A0A7J6E078_CANSA|nr:hypothetical protein F8388_019535 [Cannabis sativa]